MIAKPDIIRKVLALFAKADASKNPNEHEVAAALAKAKALMAEHHLTMSELRSAKDAKENATSYVRTATTPRSAPPRWEMDIAVVVAEIVPVYPYESTAKGVYPFKQVIIFVGEEFDTAIATEIYYILVKEIKKMIRVFLQDNPGLKRSEGFAYGKGVQVRLGERAREAKYAAEAKRNAECRDLVVAKRDMIKEHVQKTEKLRQAHNRTRISAPFLQGVADGDKINLDFKSHMEGSGPEERRQIE